MPLSADMPAPVSTATDCAAARRSRASSISGIRLQGLPHTLKGFGRIRAVHADDGTAFSSRAPACKHARRGEAGEDTDQRDTAGGGDMLAGGIVADIQT